MPKSSRKRAVKGHVVRSAEGNKRVSNSSNVAKTSRKLAARRRGTS